MTANPPSPGAGISGVTPLLERFVTEAWSIWLSGGWAMIALAACAFMIFGLGTHVHWRITGKGFRNVTERTWRHWIRVPEARIGAIGEIIDFASSAATPAEMAESFEEVRKTEVVPFERDLRLMRIAVTAAPLLGLLGTVTGMLTTFSALSTGSGGDETMLLVASGISEALITTETGLVVALPGLFYQYHLARHVQTYRAFLAHVETVCQQELLRRRTPSSAVAA